MQRRRPAFAKTHTDPLDLNLRALDIFVQIAESGGMSQTARRVGLTQSAISQVIANLEQSIGVQLFDRHVRPIALTPSGVVLLDRARTVLASARDAIHAARQPAAAVLPKLNLCLVDTVASTIGPDLIASLHSLAAHWSIHAGLSGPHRQALLSREADIIVTPDAMEDDPGLERHEILREPFFIAVPIHYSGPVDSIANLSASLDLVRFSMRSLIGKQVQRHLGRLRVEAASKLELDTSDSVLAMVAGQLGWAIITPLCAIQGRTYWPAVRFLPLPERAFSRRIFVIGREGELGDIPRKVADISAAALRVLIETKFIRAHPWSAPMIHIPQTPFEMSEEGCISCGPAGPG